MVKIIRVISRENALPTMSGFTQAGVYSRRQFCADIQVCSPQERLWNPRLREAATTLAATRRQRSANWQSGDNESTSRKRNRVPNYRNESAGQSVKLPKQTGKTCEAVRTGENTI